MHRSLNKVSVDYVNILGIIDDLPLDGRDLFFEGGSKCENNSLHVALTGSIPDGIAENMLRRGRGRGRGKGRERNEGTLERVLFQTVTRNPLRRRLRAIALPMIPRPKNPTSMNAPACTQEALLLCILPFGFLGETETK
ncbi:hypothetical protein M5K25_008082 [Dendrobium thyrsiflorum]|uniref:Uncharacterized protein n=1 Tax=Dendrobium thyrsiflorum TaxID=117978 RepID=A0ABD0VEJ4_DENTH